MEFSILCGNIVSSSKNYIGVDFGWLWPAQTSSNQFGLVQIVHIINSNSVACHTTSDLDFNKWGCVIQIWED